jgi:cytosine permease
MSRKNHGLAFDTQQNSYQLSAIQLAGGNWGMPVMGVAVNLYLSVGFGLTVSSILIGNLFILVAYYFFVKMSSSTRINAVQNVERHLGKVSGRFFAFVILITMIGWLAVGLQRLAEGLDGLSFSLPGVNINIIVGCVASIVLLFGIKGLRVLMSIIAPVILVGLLLCFVLVGAKSGYTINAPLIPRTFTLSGLIPIIIVLLDSVIEYPTFYRHSRSLRHSITSLMIVFIGTCAAQILIIFIGQGDEISRTTLISAQMFDQPVLSSLAIALLILSTLGASAWNIYAASVGWESLFPQFKDRTEYAVIGLSAIILLVALPVGSILNHIVDVGAIPIVAAVVVIIGSVPSLL